jgi:hypothetical protein
MHDVNPLGPMFHLKELERQAAPRLRPVSPHSVGARSAAHLSLKSAMSILLSFLLHPKASSIRRRTARVELTP